MKILERSIQCRSDSLPVAERSTRRTATVTISVPEASCAAFMTACDEYFPVPTTRREENGRPAITSGSDTPVIVRDPSMNLLDGDAHNPRLVEGARHCAVGKYDQVVSAGREA